MNAGHRGIHGLALALALQQRLKALGSRILMFCGASFSTPRAYRGDIRFIPDLFGSICSRCQLDECVQWDIHPRALGLVLLHEVCVNASQYGLVSHDENIFASLQFHNDWL